MYEYKFDFENCWYKDVCIHPKNGTCNSSYTCIRHMEMDYLLYFSQIPKRRQYPVSLSPEDIDYDKFIRLAEIKDNIEDFINCGKNLYIASQYTGNGKTSWAIKLMLRYFDSIWSGNGFRPRGVFIHVPTFLTQLKINISKKDMEFQSILDNLYDIDLVIWDDIASTKLTAYEHSQLLTYIDQRILAEKSNIFTGNLPSKQELEFNLGVRLASRIMSGEMIEFKGRDRR